MDLTALAADITAAIAARAGLPPTAAAFGWPAYAPGRRLTRIFDDPPDVASYPEEVSLHPWDQHRFGVIDLAAEAAQR